MGSPSKGVYSVQDSELDGGRLALKSNIGQLMADLLTRYNATMAKLDADSGVPFTDYAARASMLSGFLNDLNVKAGEPVVINSVIDDKAERDLYHVTMTYLTAARAAFVATLAKLDADVIVNGTDYASLETPLASSTYITSVTPNPILPVDISEVTLKASDREFFNNLHDALSDFVEKYTILLGRLDADVLTDSNYAATNPAPTLASYLTK